MDVCQEGGESCASVIVEAEGQVTPIHSLLPWGWLGTGPEESETEARRNAARC